LRLRAAVFASGRGSNFEILADHGKRGGTGAQPGRSDAGTSPWDVVLVVSDRVDAPVLERARARGIEATVIPARERPEQELAQETLSRLRLADIDLVLLAGYLRLIPGPVVAAFRDRMLNVHPALLPAFGGKGMYGMHVHRAVLEAGVRITGPTVHLVDEEYDRGRILAQWPVPVLLDDTPETLARRVIRVEHRLFPMTVDAVARGLVEDRAPGAIPHADPDSEPYFRLDSGTRTSNPFEPFDP